MVLPSLCSDAATLKNLLQEIGNSYRALLEGRTDGQPEPIQYADYAEWQRELFESPADDAALGRQFWRARRLASRDLSRLPMEDRPRAGLRFQPAVLPVPFPPELMARATALAKEEGTSIVPVLRACWAGLICRLTGEASITMGEVDSGRRHEGLSTALGLFDVPFPETHRLRPDLSVRNAVRHMNDALEESSPWRDYAPAEVVGEPRDALFAFEEEEEIEPLVAHGVSFSLLNRFSCTTRFGLKLLCRRSHDGATGELHFDSGRLRPESAARLAGHLAVLLREAIEDPASPLDRLPLLEPGEARRLLVDFNTRVPRSSTSRCVHELFEEQVRKTPSSIAVVFDRDRWTYRDLNSRANQLARFLRTRGLRRDSRVGLCLERSAQMIEGLLGIMKAGGAYVPLNPEHPKGRLAGQLIESEAAILVTQEGLADRFADFSGLIVCLDRDRPALDEESGTDVEGVSRLEDLVSVIYTSGSTGAPKGVATPHGALANYVAAICNALGEEVREEQSSALHFASVSTISADLGNTAIFPALVSGGTLHLIPYDVATDGSRFGEYLERHPIDVLKIVPSHFRALIGSPARAANFPRRFLILGGEALDLELAKEVAGQSRCVILNHYGPTETTVGSLMFRFGERPIDPSSSSVPIGRPIANTDIYILDPRGHPVPIGIPGELYIGGAGLARGYLGRPDETADRFVPHPFAGDRPRRLYRTGDLARYHPDATVEFLGRLDDQVKIRGYRVEPGEVTETLRKHPSVREGFVLARDGPGGARLVAYVVPREPSPPRREELRQYLSDRLPDYMVPGAFLLMDSLPLTANGKLDVRALPDPEAGQDRERTFVAPRTQVEEVLAEVWSDLLRVSPIGVHDDFFALGGHSLLATQLISRVRTALGLEVSLRTLFDGPTIAQLAGTIGATAPAAAVHLMPMAGLAGPDLAVPSDVLERVGQLSDEEVNTLLADILARDRASE